MKTFLRIALFVTVASSSLFGLVTITPVELGEKPGWSSKVGVSLSTKRGNSDVDAYKLSARTNYDNNISYVTWFQLSGEYGQASGEKNVQKSFAHLRYIHNLTDKFHVYETALQSEEDEFRLIKSRRLAAVGYRQHLFPKERLKTFIGLGVMYEYIKFTSSYDPTEYNVRASCYLSMSYEFEKDKKLSFISYFQPKLDDVEDFVTVNQLGLKIKIEGELYLNFSLSYNYDARPAIEVESEYDFSQDTAFIYEF